jgi:hypothetical protein
MKPIRFYLTQRQAAILQKIFDERENPNFTILKAELVSQEEDVYAVDVFFESTMSMWFVIQLAYVEEEYQNKLDEISADMRKALDNFLKKLS